MAAAAARFLRLFFNRLFTVFFAALFRAKYFAECLRIIFAFYQLHFANRTFFLEKIKHNVI